MENSGLRIAKIAVILLSLVAGVTRADGAELTNTITAGVFVRDAGHVIGQLGDEPRLEEEDVFFVGWPVPLDGSADISVIESVRLSGATPWIRVVFRTPAPLSGHASELEAELRELARLTSAAGSGAFIQGVWEPEDGSPTPKDQAYLIKKAAVAATGAAPDAQFVGGPFVGETDFLRKLYDEEVAAYLDLVAVKPVAGVSATVAALGELDPGKKIVLDAIEWPTDPIQTVARVAEGAAAGFSVVFFDARASDRPELAPLKVVTRELRGQPVYDRSSSPRGTGRSWAFVLENLDLRVIALPGTDPDSLELIFDDLQLGAPDRVDLQTGQADPLYGIERTARRFKVMIDDSDDVVLLRLERRAPLDDDLFGGEIDIAAYDPDQKFLQGQQTEGRRDPSLHA